MRRIEQLLAADYNKRSFQKLVSDKIQDKLVVLYGAGLSLWKEYTRWGYPFSWSFEKIDSSYKRIIDYYGETEIESQTKNALDKIGAQIETCKELLKKDESAAYLEMGDILSEAIPNLKTIYENTPISYEFPYHSFFDFCKNAFSEKGEPPTYDYPYMIPALYYLPHLTRLLITTNVDCSFETMCELSGQDFWCSYAIKPKEDSALEKWNFSSYAILYIHGHIKEPDSLVMTGKEYEKMYSPNSEFYEGPKGSYAVLKKVANEYSVLFLGTSLQTDTTVTIFNSETESEENRNNRNANDLHFTTITELKTNGKEFEKPPRLKNFISLTFDNKMYQEVSFYLLHLIRTTDDYSKKTCRWTEPSSALTDISVPDDILGRIETSLQDNKLYEVIRLPAWSIEKQKNIIHYLYEHYSIEQHEEKAGDGWSICCISDLHFSLGGDLDEGEKGNSPIHNYPLGDTIYLLQGGRLLNEAEEERIITEIEQWCRGIHGDRDIRISDPDENGVILPRIRIIVIPPDSISIQKESCEALLERIEQGLDPVAIRQFVIELLTNAIENSYGLKNTKKEIEQTNDESTELTLTRTNSPR